MQKVAYRKSAGLIEVAAMTLGFLAAVVLLSLSSARAKARDAKRLADVRQIASALELYLNDKSQYPASLSALEPIYIGVVPTAPLPIDGSCTQDQNQYTYAKISNQDYKLTFCLGQYTNGYMGGVHELTSQGIK